jgi:hypothetical protein
MSDFTQLGITLTSPERAVFLLVCATIGEVHAAVTGDKPDKSNVFKPYKLPGTCPLTKRSRYVNGVLI